MSFVYQRLVFLVSPFILAVVAAVFLFSWLQDRHVPPLEAPHLLLTLRQGRPLVAKVTPASQQLTLQVDDEILFVDQTEIDSPATLLRALGMSVERPRTLVVRRRGEEVALRRPLPGEIKVSWLTTDTSLRSTVPNSVASVSPSSPPLQRRNRDERRVSPPPAPSADWRVRHPERGQLPLIEGLQSTLPLPPKDLAPHPTPDGRPRPQRFADLPRAGLPNPRPDDELPFAGNRSPSRPVRELPLSPAHPAVAPPSQPDATDWQASEAALFEPDGALPDGRQEAAVRAKDPQAFPVSREPQRVAGEPSRYATEQTQLPSNATVATDPRHTPTGEISPHARFFPQPRGSALTLPLVSPRGELIREAFRGCDTCGDPRTSSCDVRSVLSKAQQGLHWGGWVSAGYHDKNNGLFNDRPGELAFHQGWIYAERRATEQNPVGLRVDLLYGIDGADTQAFGNDPGEFDFGNAFDHGAYAWAIPQLYVDVVFADWRVKAGHFFTPLGFESVSAPDNFFYSHAMTMVNSEPFTHSGLLAERAIGDEATIFAGWTLGWDTGFDQRNAGNAWLGGWRYQLHDNIRLSVFSTLGNFGARGDDAMANSLVLLAKPLEPITWILQFDTLRVDSTGEDNLGLNQYVLYRCHRDLDVGARLEWWKGDVLTGYVPHDGVLPAFGSLSYYAATLGANYRPQPHIVLRPEIRVDWSPAANYSQTYASVDAIVTF